MTLQDLFEATIPKQDITDAKKVLKDWAVENRVDTGGRGLDRAFDEAYSKGSIEELDPHAITIWHDWGRRPNSETPPILARLKDGKIIILDGQHRIIVAREEKKKIKCFVIELPLRFSRARKRYILD
jgi:hypothetical protein